MRAIAAAAVPGGAGPPEPWGSPTPPLGRGAGPPNFYHTLFEVGWDMYTIARGRGVEPPEP